MHTHTTRSWGGPDFTWIMRGRREAPSVIFLDTKVSKQTGWAAHMGKIWNWEKITGHVVGRIVNHDNTLRNYRGKCAYTIDVLTSSILTAVILEPFDAKNVFWLPTTISIEKKLPVRVQKIMLKNHGRLGLAKWLERRLHIVSQTAQK